MFRILVSAFAWTCLLLPCTRSLWALEVDSVTYRVRQTVTLGPIEKDAESVKWWVSIPGDNPDQKILDFAVVSAPGPWRIVREPTQGNRFLYVEAKSPGRTSLDVVIDFTLRRRPVHVSLDPEHVGRIEASQRNLFAQYLRRDAPHMEVTPEIQKLADETCGDETNIARQVKQLLGRVATLADHYSKDPTKPSCGIGDAKNCLTQGGGCCTDLHSLFISMARARGIPARLQMGYRLLEKNEDKEADPGYRCWVEYFAPGYGWVPSDIVEADAPEGLGFEVWFSGLTARRLWLNQGRNLILDCGEATRRANHMSIAYAEIDGTPARVLPEDDLPKQLSRTIHFESLRSESTFALSADTR